MHKLSIAAVILLAAIPSVAGAADWYRINQSRLGATYTDLAAATREGDEIRVTEYTIWFPAAEADGRAIEQRMAVRCRDRAVRTMISTTILESGRRISGPPADTGWRSMPSGSNGEYMLLFHCGEIGRGARLGNVTPEEDFRRLTP
jgi:hypothetical protein